MDETRLHNELDQLSETYRLRYDEATGTVVLEDCELPVGWTPRVIEVRYDLPARWPRAAPRVVLPGELRYQGTVPRALLTSGQWLVRGHLGDPIIHWPVWRRQACTLTTLTDRVLDDLATMAAADQREAGDA